jgi:hypothetical protein
MATALWGIAALSTRHAIVEAENLSKHQKDKVDLEFCPDEPNEPESPLDDIRKMI